MSGVPQSDTGLATMKTAHSRLADSFLVCVLVSIDKVTGSMPGITAHCADIAGHSVNLAPKKDSCVK
jgi:hypothetical protein